MKKAQRASYEALTKFASYHAWRNWIWAIKFCAPKCEWCKDKAYQTIRRTSPVSSTHFCSRSSLTRFLAQTCRWRMAASTRSCNSSRTCAPSRYYCNRSRWLFTSFSSCSARYLMSSPSRAILQLFLPKIQRYSAVSRGNAADRRLRFAAELTF